MAVSIIDLIIENTRQNLTGDEDYYKDMPYYFKLITKRGKGPMAPAQAEAIFPLPINPQILDYTLPFAAEVVPLQEGGALAEEGGIVVGNIVLEATTGLKLRQNRDNSWGDGGGRFTGLLPSKDSYYQKLSGQMAMWRFIGRCFDSYSELKKDPEAAHKTSMEFHGLKDDIHLEIIPRQVSIPRNVSDAKIIYKYRIEADVIGQAKPPGAADRKLLEDDSSIIDTILNGIHLARKSVQNLKATIDDFTACIDEIKRTVSNIIEIVEDLKFVIKAGEDFITGASSFFYLPSEWVGSLVAVVEAAVTASETVSGLKRGFVRALKDTVDHLEAIMVATKGSTKDDWDQKAEIHQKNIQINSRLTTEERTSINDLTTRASASGGTMKMSEVFGTFSPGDSRRITQAEPIPRIQPGKYTGFREIELKGSDTIESLASRHIGDPSEWRDIAIINRLVPPYISYDGARIPGTLVPGDKILLPVGFPVAPTQVVATGDPVTGSSQVEQFMGTDIRARRLPSGQYDWWIDTAHSSTDLQYVSGIDNLVQGLTTRMRTEKGSNLNFPDVGLPRLIGNQSTDQLWKQARFSLQQEVLADPRIERVKSLSFAVNKQKVTMTVDAQPVGFDTNRPMPLMLT